MIIVKQVILYKIFPFLIFIKHANGFIDCFSRKSCSNERKSLRRVRVINERPQKLVTPFFLFFGENFDSVKNNRRHTKRTVPSDVIDNLSSNQLTLPVRFDLENVSYRVTSSSTTQLMTSANEVSSTVDDENPLVSSPLEVSTTETQTKGSESKENKEFIVRQLEEEDIKTAVRLCIREYGSFPSAKNGGSSSKSEIEKMVDEQMMQIENWIFSFVVSIGLTQRISRRKESDDSSAKNNNAQPPDHNVICITRRGNDGEEDMIGMAEVSLQPPNPGLTSPPYVLPLSLKKILSIILGARILSPYISNVLIKDEFRGKGYSKVLMAACEGLAKSWGFHCAYLHVDANMVSGAAAQGLYKNLGYKPVVDEKNNSKFDWMGPELVNRGLYVVDGVPLLYLRKDFS